MLVLRLGWRNLWRNPRRTAVSISSIAFAFAILIVAVGLMAGYAVQMVESGTGVQMGHLQIHHPDYLPDRSLYDTVGGDNGCPLDELLAACDDLPGVVETTLRVHGFALVSTGERSSGAQLLGIDAGREAATTTLLRGMMPDNALAGRTERPIVLGEALAEELDAKLGSEVAAVTQSADGSMGNELYIVTGILRTGISTVDRSMALMQLVDLQELLTFSPDRIHEVAVRLEDPDLAGTAAAALRSDGRLPKLAEVRTWRQLSPQLVEFLVMARGFNLFTIILVGFLASLGVLNTLSMSVFERTKELGVLTSLGTRPWVIVAMILGECLCLDVLGLLIGLGLGAASMPYLINQGLDFSTYSDGFSIAGIFMEPSMHAVWAWRETAESAALLAVMSVAASLIPAGRAALLRPVKALSAPVEG